MTEIQPQKLKSMIDGGEDLQIIDIREKHEVDSGEISDMHIPMAEVMDRLDEIRKDCPVVIYCKSGSRAGAVVHVLETEKGFTNVHCLCGGIQAWADHIDPNVNVYG
jgi:rhodanese-related sulfurtransferase